MSAQSEWLGRDREERARADLEVELPELERYRSRVLAEEYWDDLKLAEQLEAEAALVRPSPMR